jgi:hypothetical protein
LSGGIQGSTDLAKQQPESVTIPIESKPHAEATLTSDQDLAKATANRELREANFNVALDNTKKSVLKTMASTMASFFLPGSSETSGAPQGPAESMRNILVNKSESGVVSECNC